MPSFTFTVELQGTGVTPEEAWVDAVDSFACEPGEPLDFEMTDDEYDCLLEEDTDTLNRDDDRDCESDHY